MSELTRILQSAAGGRTKAAAELLPLVYEELRKLAASKMAGESSNQTLQPTALVHEAWLRLTGNENVKWEGRAHFFGAAAGLAIGGGTAVVRVSSRSYSIRRSICYTSPAHQLHICNKKINKR